MWTIKLRLILLMIESLYKFWEQIRILRGKRSKTLRTHLDLGGDEECRDAEELQALLADVILRKHETVKEILCQVRRLPVEAVHLAHL